MKTYDELASLVTAYQNGNEDAYNEIHEGIYPIIKKLVSEMLYNDAAPHNAEDIEDCCMECEIKVAYSLKDLKEPKTLPAWVKRISYNTCLDFCKKSGNVYTVSTDAMIGDDADIPFEIEDDDPAFSPDAQMDKKHVVEVVQEFMSTLPADQKAALFLVLGEEYTCKEAAEITGVNENTIKYRISAAKKKFTDNKEWFKKRGVDLAAIPFATLLSLYFKKDVYAAAAAGAATAAAGTTAATAAGTAGTAAGAAGVAGAAIAKGIGAKVIIGVLAATLVGVGTAAAIVKTAESRKAAETTVYEEEKNEELKEEYEKEIDSKIGKGEAESPETDTVITEAETEAIDYEALFEQKKTELEAEHPSEDGKNWWFEETDIDNNGVPELYACYHILGQEFTDYNHFYVISNGQLVDVLEVNTQIDGNRAYISEDGKYLMTAYQDLHIPSVYEEYYYTLRGINLILKESIVTNYYEEYGVRYGHTVKKDEKGNILEEYYEFSDDGQQKHMTPEEFEAWKAGMDAYDWPKYLDLAVDDYSYSTNNAGPGKAFGYERIYFDTNRFYYGLVPTDNSLDSIGETDDYYEVPFDIYQVSIVPGEFYNEMSTDFDLQRGALMGTVHIRFRKDVKLQASEEEFPNQHFYVNDYYRIHDITDAADLKDILLNEHWLQFYVDSDAYAYYLYYDENNYVAGISAYGFAG